MDDLSRTKQDDKRPFGTPREECHDLPQPRVFTPRSFQDNRGAFTVIWSHDWTPFEVLQENESVSKRGVIRGLHLQIAPHAQTKLIRVVWGRVMDVIVDLRENTPDRGKVFSFELSSENRSQLLIPKGFAHGFAVLSETAVVNYKVDTPWVPAAERCIRYDDPELGITWPIPDADRILSPKDCAGLSYRQWRNSGERA